MAFLSFHTKLRFLGKVQRESIVSIFHWDTNCFDAFIGKPPDDVQKEKLLSRLGFEISYDLKSCFSLKKIRPKRSENLSTILPHQANPSYTSIVSFLLSKLFLHTPKFISSKNIRFLGLPPILALKMKRYIYISI